MSLICNVSQAQLLLCFSYTPIPTYHSHNTAHSCPLFVACFYAVTRIWKLRKNNGKNTSFDIRVGGRRNERQTRNIRLLLYAGREREKKRAFHQVSKLKKENTTMQRFPHCSHIMLGLGVKRGRSATDWGLHFALPVLFTYLPSAFA